MSLSLVVALSACTTFDLYSEEGRRQLEQVSLRIDTFDVEIYSRGEIIWHGTAKLNRRQSSSVTVDGLEASGQRCSRPGSEPSNRYKVEFVASKSGGNAIDPDRYQFKASIWKSAFAADCKTPIFSEAGTSKTVRMRQGQRIDLDGKDGFGVTIVRR